MVLRHQCRRLVLLKRPHRLPSCQFLHRPLHTTPFRSREGDIEDFVTDEGIIEAPENLEEDEPGPDRLAEMREKAASEMKTDVKTKTYTKTLTLAEIDKSMQLADLGLKRVKRRTRKTFLSWLIQDGPAHEHFPQTLVNDIEERRVEKIRKRAEDRMFARMNAFFNSLTREEIQEGQLQGIVTKGKDGQNRVPLQENPSPFTKLMREQKDPKVVESKVLALLNTYDLDTHRMYRNYIEWCDFKLQKQTVWFDFSRMPPERSEECGDLITRLRTLEELGDNPTPPPPPAQPDLAAHLGRSFGDRLVYFRPPIVRHYLRAGSNTPFLLNPTFKPWRPLSHTTRQQMFDAWREGLGLRNIAWLGGVSWRRVDGVIGILKREWDFVRQGGKLEHHMAEYMEGLLAATPIGGSVLPRILISPQNLFRNSVRREWETPSEEGQTQKQPEDYADLLTPDIPLADPPIRQLSGKTKREPLAPNPKESIFFEPQSTTFPKSVQVTSSIDQEHKKIRDWEASQKEPLVEIPIKRTKQYFAIIQEMEEYDEKRAAKALDGTDGRTMSEKEDGIKMFQAFFGGLRSLEGRNKYQGRPPWELETSAVIRRQLIKQAKKKDEKTTTQQRPKTTSSLTPADSFRLANATDSAALINTAVKSPTERVVWRFEDVSWVKQRTTRPRKKSYVGRLDFRVQTESGVARYGPFGIGSGIEGVGGVKQVIERGRDGRVRAGPGEREKKRVRREIVV